METDQFGAGKWSRRKGAKEEGRRFRHSEIAGLNKQGGGSTSRPKEELVVSGGVLTTVGLEVICSRTVPLHRRRDGRSAQVDHRRVVQYLRFLAKVYRDGSLEDDDMPDEESYWEHLGPSAGRCGGARRPYHVEEYGLQRTRSHHVPVCLCALYVVPSGRLLALGVNQPWRKDAPRTVCVVGGVERAGNRMTEEAEETAHTSVWRHGERAGGFSLHMERQMESVTT